MDTQGQVPCEANVATDQRTDDQLALDTNVEQARGKANSHCKARNDQRGGTNDGLRQGAESSLEGALAPVKD